MTETRWLAVLILLGVVMGAVTLSKKSLKPVPSQTQAPVGAGGEKEVKVQSDPQPAGVVTNKIESIKLGEAVVLPLPSFVPNKKTELKPVDPKYRETARLKVREALSRPLLGASDHEQAVQFGSRLYRAELTQEQTVALRALKNPRLEALVVAAEMYSDSPDQQKYARYVYDQFATNPSYWINAIQGSLVNLSDKNFPVARAASEEFLKALKQKAAGAPPKIQTR